MSVFVTSVPERMALVDRPRAYAAVRPANVLRPVPSRNVRVLTAERSIGDYVERFYNLERLHSHLDYGPVEFELKAQTNHLAHNQTGHQIGGGSYWLLPITAEEKTFRHAHGLEALEQRFEQAGLEYWNLKRRSVVP